LIPALSHQSLMASGRASAPNCSYAPEKFLFIHEHVWTFITSVFTTWKGLSYFVFLLVFVVLSVNSATIKISQIFYCVWQSSTPNSDCSDLLIL